ncbi:hypothetical protein pmac_cds_497 [Pandoravirus macleodensis]|uniref:Uncharacterized protein n=1 Tax=Pandoravirus macleodensis TaxID=2107707 RepID=A0A2U7UFN4_9VIRU|nr:hypothetical protein pmac_cds_497 [Pandoravirus macleodensis]AVK77185.1 hypothetical protein pmac_cds_497 [Pandoravirus macleodensis]UMO79903.1 hypothetical protein [Pandoravirus aubagnensis]
MCTLALARQTLDNASKTIDRNMCMITPLEAITEADAIKDARGRGVPHAVFYDTSDKVVVFPDHIPGFEAKYENYSFAWGDACGWTDACQAGDRCAAYRTLQSIAQKLRANGTNAQVVSAWGSNKGHLGRVTFDNGDQACPTKDREVADIALWIWTTNDDLVSLMWPDVDAPLASARGRS